MVVFGHLAPHSRAHCDPPSALQFALRSDGQVALIQIKSRSYVRDLSFHMRNERAEDLARACTDMMRKGESFPAVWEKRLKAHPLTNGLPRQKLEGSRVILEIPLITGDFLIFDGDARSFSVL